MCVRIVLRNNWRNGLDGDVISLEARTVLASVYSHCFVKEKSVEKLRYSCEHQSPPKSFSCSQFYSFFFPADFFWPNTRRPTNRGNGVRIENGHTKQTWNAVTECQHLGHIQVVSSLYSGAHHVNESVTNILLRKDCWHLFRGAQTMTTTSDVCATKGVRSVLREAGTQAVARHDLRNHPLPARR